MVHAWYLGRLVEQLRTAALIGDKTAHESTRQRMADFDRLIDGDPRLDNPDRLRETWGTGQQAEQGARGMMAIAGGPAGYLDDPGPEAPPG